MRSKQTIATSVIFGLTILAIPLWLISYPETTFRHNLNPWLISSSQLAGLLGFVLYSFSLLLSTRLKWVEDSFGGLDKVYQAHHNIGKIAFFLLLYHPLALAARWIPQDFGKAIQYLLPTHRRLAIDLGSWALLVFFLLMLVTLIIKIPYDKWKLTHKLTGIVFLLIIPHFFLLDELVNANIPLAIYVGFFSLLGVISFLYKSVFFDWISDKKSYTVKKVNRLNNKVMEVTLAPDNSQLEFIPGQFCFFSYRHPNISREAHPYTICSTTSENNITIVVKALGDYTNHLYNTLEVGAKTLIEGPYGRFNYNDSNQPQLWVAGGVGIAPFISWANDLLMEPPPSDFNAELYYCVNSEEEAIHVEKFKELESTISGFSFHLTCADREGFLSVKEIQDFKGREIFICGPKEMRQSLLKEFRQLQVPGKNIHFEDFDFS
jgi:predicted ferric reductase